MLLFPAELIFDEGVSTSTPEKPHFPQHVAPLRSSSGAPPSLDSVDFRLFAAECEQIVRSSLLVPDITREPNGIHSEYPNIKGRALPGEGRID